MIDRKVSFVKLTPPTPNLDISGRTPPNPRTGTNLSIAVDHKNRLKQALVVSLPSLWIPLPFLFRISLWLPTQRVKRRSDMEVFIPKPTPNPLPIGYDPNAICHYHQSRGHWTTAGTWGMSYRIWLIQSSLFYRPQQLSQTSITTLLGSSGEKWAHLNPLNRLRSSTDSLQLHRPVTYSLTAITVQWLFMFLLFACCFRFLIVMWLSGL